jgi:hypothetical protein
MNAPQYCKHCGMEIDGARLKKQLASHEAN